jgi:hypothetical protein
LPSIRSPICTWLSSRSSARDWKRGKRMSQQPHEHSARGGAGGQDLETT